MTLLRQQALMISFPHAKINLGLYVTQKRSDGFHNILSCLYPISWSDALEILPAEEFHYSASGLFIPGDTKDNLCIKAYQLLRKKFDLPPIQMHLHKVIPMGAGLGGGSSDAAFALKSLNSLFKLSLTNQELMDFAASLGSDCPFFIEGQPVMASGTGNTFAPIKLSLQGYNLVIVNPGIPISTIEAYAEIRPKPLNFDLSEILMLPIIEWEGKLINDFEPIIFEKYPEIAAIKHKLYADGAEYASMSGSGSSVFGFFKRDKTLKHKFPEHYTIWEQLLG